MKKDRIFDGLSQRFQQKIYHNDDPRGAIRLHIVQDDLHFFPFMNQPLQVLDAGGGTGLMSLWMAQQGHSVTLADPSPEMLQAAQHTLKKHTEKDGPVTLKQASIQQLSTETTPTLFDFIICHAVLEWLAEPRQTLAQLLGKLKPGGWLSLMFFNINSKTMRHLLAGDFQPVLEDRIASDGNNGLAPISPLNPEEVLSWLPDLGLNMHQWSGVRCFYDYSHPEVRKKMQLEELLLLERHFSVIEPWRSLARYQHLVCQKAG